MRLWRRPKTRRKFRLTRDGKAFVLITVGVGFAAVNTANNLLYLVLGFLLSLLLVSGVLSDLALWKLKIRRALPQRIFAGAEMIVDVYVRNDKTKLATIALEASEVSHEGLGIAHFVRIEPAAEQSSTYCMRFEKRGLYKLSRLKISTRYPFGLIEKGFTIFCPAEVIVYPALGKISSRLPSNATVGDQLPRPRVGSGNELSGSVREYTVGDPARDIHWRRTAARGHLMVREKQSEAREQVVLFVENRFDPSVAAANWREDFEARISEAAAQAAHFLSQGIAVEVRSSNGTSGVVQGGLLPDPIWRFLALLRPVAGVPDADLEAAA